MRRRVLYYLFNIIFPCIWLSILSVLGFWLPPDSGEKITLGITVLLAFSVFMLLIAESMPATSEMVPLIEIYLTAVMALTSLSIVLTVYVLQLHHSGPVVTAVPRGFKYSLVRYVAPVVGMRKIVEIYAREHHLIDSDDVYRCFRRATESPSRSSHNKRTAGKQQIQHRQSNMFSSHNSALTRNPPRIDDHQHSHFIRIELVRLFPANLRYLALLRTSSMIRERRKRTV